jgi:PAS domain S-box-containing protein
MAGQAATFTTPLLDLLFDDDLVGRCLVAPDGSVLRANAEWLRSTGFTLDEVLGADLVSLFPQTRDMALALHARARAGFAVQVPRHLQRLHGAETWWEGRIAPVPMEGGVGLLVTARDVTAEVSPADEAQRAETERLRRMLGSITDGLLVLDRTWRYTFVSERAAQIIGARREDLLGRCVWDLFPQARGTRFWNGYHLAMETGNVVHFVEYYPEPLRMWLECHCYPMDDGLTVFFRDVSDQRRADEALREEKERTRSRAAELEALLDAVPAAVFIARDRESRTIDANRFAASLLQVPRGSNVSKTAGDRAPPPGYRALRGGVEIPPEELPVQRAAARGDEVRDYEFEVVSQDGEVRHLFGNAAPLRGPDGAPAGAVAAFLDITERKRAEAALHEANARLREADRRKDEFLGMLSHELRNPLAPIRNSIWILRHGPGNPEQVDRAQRIIERQTEHLTRLVDDLLDVTRIARGRIELRRARVDLAEVVARAAEDFRPVMRDREIAFDLALPSARLWVDADPTRVTQIVGNLLHNASKFTRRGDAVSLSLAAAGGWAELRVRDTGAGIEPALLPLVFEPFVQGARTLARTEGGLGLGLALVKGIAELHGGAARAESAGKGHGAEFVVTLPLAAAPS